MVSIPIFNENNGDRIVPTIHVYVQFKVNGGRSVPPHNKSRAMSSCLYFINF